VVEGSVEQLGKQAVAVVGTMLYSGIMSLIILFVLDKIPGLGLRVSEIDEDLGLDLAVQGEQATVRDGAD
jgi:Amt family ammonium transporter